MSVSALIAVNEVSVWTDWLWLPVNWYGYCLTFYCLLSMCCFGSIAPILVCFRTQTIKILDIFCRNEYEIWMVASLHTDKLQSVWVTGHWIITLTCCLCKCWCVRPHALLMWGVDVKPHGWPLSCWIYVDDCVFTLDLHTTMKGRGGLRRRHTWCPCSTSRHGWVELQWCSLSYIQKLTFYY